MKKIITTSARQTFALGKKIAKNLRGGEVIGIRGQLGAGKTVLIKGIAAGLGIKKTVTSPTFTLINIYPLKTKHDSNKSSHVSGTRQLADKLVHVDCYRIKKVSEMAAIGLIEYLNDPHAITVIEWPEKIKSLLPRRPKKIAIAIGKKITTRLIYIS